MVLCYNISGDNMELVVNNKEEMASFAKYIARHCKVGDVILLNGDLGAGKTFFTSQFAIQLGVKETVNSPTFTIAKEYKGIYELFHIDAYRLEGVEEDVGYILDFYNEGITIIEWPEFITDYIPYSYVQLYITRIGDNQRKIDFSFVNKDELKKVVENYVKEHSCS